MNKKSIKLNILLAIFFAFLLMAGHAMALEVHYPTIFGVTLNEANATTDQYGCYLFVLLTALAIFTSVIMIAIGGIYFLIDYGRGKFTDEGKDRMKSAGVGLLIIVCSYLIAYTINPAGLSTCPVVLVPLIHINFSGNTSSSSNVDFTSYNEIPIGILSENLLTRTMDCYAFDPEGNPIEGQQKTDDGKDRAPTYMNHDRADCITQLADGAQKKSQVIAELSNQIIKLMNTCSCSNPDGSSKCDPACGGGANCNENNFSKCPNGSCESSSCSKTNPKTSGCKKGKKGPPDCCPTGVKDKIEHGPVQVGCGADNAALNNLKNIFATLGIKNNSAAGLLHNPILLADANAAPAANNNCCDVPLKTYNGLDEFRCPNPKDTSTPPCNNDQKMLDYVEKQVQINKKTVTIINKDNWAKLNLMQQLVYYKAKINQIKGNIMKDAAELNQAKSYLSNCYLAMPYVDVVKTAQTTNQKEHVIFSQQMFSDPLDQGKMISASKYCNGYNYGNSSCFKKCNDECPDTNPDIVSKYKACDGNCEDDDQTCLDKQDTCVEKVYNERPCIYNSDKPKQKYQDCISDCQNDCSNLCNQKYLSCYGENKACNDQCANNSKCILKDNPTECVFGSQGLIDCSEQITDQGNINHCIKSAYLCKNGSDEYAGYADCATPWGGDKCSAIGANSASFFYDHPECLKCQNPYNPPDAGSICDSGSCPQTNSASCKAKANTSCQSLCPEVSKCPTSSNCPYCPCDQVGPTVTFSMPDENQSNNAANETETPEVVKASAHEIVGPQCNSYSYNDDPLTFYCENDWWNDPSREGTNPTPIGTERICPVSGEVPVGKTVDDAESWATTITNNAGTIVGDITGMEHLMDIIGQAIHAPNNVDPGPIENYCGCDAQDNSANPICQTDCRYSQQQVPVVDADGNTVMQWNCSCTFVACSGSPCRQLIGYLSAVWNKFVTLKQDYINFYTSMILEEPRSDIMKELEYSRQKTNDCSLVNSAYNLKTRLFDCTRVEDETISPIAKQQITLGGITKEGCYGGQENGGLGKYLNLTDNWFCCQEWQPLPTQRNQPQ